MSKKQHRVQPPKKTVAAYLLERDPAIPGQCHKCRFWTGKRFLLLFTDWEDRTRPQRGTFLRKCESPVADAVGCYTSYNQRCASCAPKGE